MRTLRETPPRLVEKGRIAAYGLFRTPFRDMNILDADIFGAGSLITKLTSPFRLKQWQHIALICEDILLAFSVVDAHYLSNSFCYVVDRKTGAYFEHHREVPGKASKVARELWNDHCEIKRKGYHIRIDNRLSEGAHRVSIDIASDGKKPAIRADVELIEDLVKVQPLIVVLPINDERRPLHTHKAPCPLRGKVTVGDKTYTLDEKRDFAMLDVQKTYYPFNTFWKWATCAGYDKKGRFIALNLVENIIKDDEENNENVLWVDGKLTPWGAVRFKYNGANVLDPWHIETTDGKCRLDFTPQGERKDKINMGLIMSDYHQPFGMFNGTVTDADGKTYELKNFFGVTEHHLARF